MHVVFGAYQGAIDAKPGEKVIFIGDCATWKGDIAGKLVSVESLYRDRTTKDPHRAEHDDIYVKMASVIAKLRNSTDASHVRFEGCPVSVSEQALALVFLSGAKNPFFDPRESVAFNKAYLQWRGATTMHRLQGIPYQKPGPVERGEARPVQNLSPAERGE
jgi:hypothetical protein